MRDKVSRESCRPLYRGRGYAVPGFYAVAGADYGVILTP